MSTEPESENVSQEIEKWYNIEKKFSRHYLGSKFNLWSVLGFLIAVLIIIWGLIEFNILSPSTPLVKERFPPSQTPLPQPLLPQPLYEVMGAYQHQVYFFNQSTQKAYPYDAQTGQVGDEFNLVPYENFVWSPSRNKIVFISSEYSLGSLHVVDLDQSLPHPVLITERENGINFPSEVIIRGDLPLAWSESADWIVFVAHKQTEEKDALFVIAADGSEYYRLPEKDRITSLAWADDKIVFVASENGREKRFVVNFDGGALKEVK
jgi:hypothetical protein